jgi:hypothetical protein
VKIYVAELMGLPADLLSTRQAERALASEQVEREKSEGRDG